MPTSSDIAERLAEQGDLSAEEAQEQLSALEEGLPDGQSVQDLLQELAPVSVSEDGRRIRAEPTAPEVLPDRPVTKAAHDHRIDRSFIGWERLDQWVVLAVILSILIAVFG